MSEMVERVAIAIAKDNGGDFYDSEFYTEEQRDLWRRKARAAIEAMREPTGPMIEAWKDAPSCASEPSGSRRDWTAMIDAALK